MWNPRDAEPRRPNVQGRRCQVWQVDKRVMFTYTPHTRLINKNGTIWPSPLQDQ